MRTSQTTPETVTTIGIDLGKNTFHLVGLNKRGAIALQRKVSRSQLEHRLSNVPRCLIGMEACSGSHHIGRQLTAVCTENLNTGVVVMKSAQDGA
jgi:hypothetical protein